MCWRVGESERSDVSVWHVVSQPRRKQLDDYACRIATHPCRSMSKCQCSTKLEAHNPIHHFRSSKPLSSVESPFTNCGSSESVRALNCWWLGTFGDEPVLFLIGLICVAATMLIGLSLEETIRSRAGEIWHASWHTVPKWAVDPTRPSRCHKP